MYLIYEVIVMCKYYRLLTFLRPLSLVLLLSTALTCMIRLSCLGDIGNFFGFVFIYFLFPILLILVDLIRDFFATGKPRKLPLEMVRCMPKEDKMQMESSETLKRRVKISDTMGGYDRLDNTLIQTDGDRIGDAGTTHTTEGEGEDSEPIITGPFIRPHPVLWRIIFGMSVVYLMILQFTLFQTYTDIKRVFGWLDPDGLSKEQLTEKVVFTQLLPNFEECWWDAIILDVLLCNGIGIWFGLKICDFLEMRQYRWESIKDIKSNRGRFKRAVMQFTPESWIKVEWFNSNALKRTMAIYLFVLIWLVVGTFCSVWLSVWWAHYSSDTKEMNIDGEKRCCYLDSSHENLGAIHDDVRRRRRLLDHMQGDVDNGSMVVMESERRVRRSATIASIRMQEKLSSGEQLSVPRVCKQRNWDFEVY
uniref:Phosphatidylserine synthase n=1 Tax=Heterorhabditis bacteriophora TaxID=37862 RepID=A0A1I7XGN9_HETBA